MALACGIYRRNQQAHVLTRGHLELVDDGLREVGGTGSSAQVARAPLALSDYAQAAGLDAACAHAGNNDQPKEVEKGRGKRL